MAPPLRHIVGQVKPKLDFTEVMDNAGVFIANLSKGRIGEHNAMLLGSLLITKFFLSALRRAGRPEAERPHFFMTIDEVHTLASDVLGAILSEARKYRLSMTAATQYLNQLSPAIQSALLGNAGSIATFRLGAEDAETLKSTFTPDVGVGELQALGPYEIYMKLAIGGMTTPPFKARTLPPMTPGYRAQRRERIIQSSRERWGARRGTVEHSIATWLGQQNPTAVDRAGAARQSTPPSWWGR
jgi:hypothetical protein